MTQASSSAGSVRSASRDSSRGSHAATRSGGSGTGRRGRGRRGGRPPRASGRARRRASVSITPRDVRDGASHAASGSASIACATAAEECRTSATRSAAGRPAPASMSAAPLLEPPGVLVALLAPRGSLQPPHHAVRVAGDVGEHVAHGSSRAVGSARAPRRRTGRSSVSSSASCATTQPATHASGRPASGCVTSMGWWTARRACRP